MLLIKCPWCGERAETEFSYGGEAGISRPLEPQALSDEDWADYLFMRSNPKGLHREQWLHAAGCRRYFNAERDTARNDMRIAVQSAAVALAEGAVERSSGGVRGRVPGSGGVPPAVGDAPVVLVAAVLGDEGDPLPVGRPGRVVGLDARQRAVEHALRVRAVRVRDPDIASLVRGSLARLVDGT